MVMQLLPDALTPDRVLELGAGTGQLTRLLLQRYPESRIDALDIASGMVAFGAYAFGGHAGVKFIHGDAATYRAAEPYPLIVSNSALQWVSNLPDAFRSIRGNLTKDGVFVCGIMLNGTLHELRELRREIAPTKMSAFVLPSRDTVESALREAGFTLHDSIYDTHRFPYENATSFLRVLHEQGVTGGTGTKGYAPLSRGEMRSIVECYQARHETEGRVYATYETLAFVAT
jgi:malonyl-CoA O-methyltransferase